MRQDDILSDFKTGLEDILREGARRLLQQAIENEVEEHLKLYMEQRDERNLRRVK